MPLERVEALLNMGERGVPRRLAIAKHQVSGLLEEVGESLRLSPRGRMLASEVAMDLL